MTQGDASSLEHLEHARTLVWDALRMLEDAQRVLFRAGDCYVAGVWGDGVRSIIDVTERITALSGDLTGIPLELDRLARRDRERGTGERP